MNRTNDTYLIHLNAYDLTHREATRATPSAEASRVVVARVVRTPRHRRSARDACTEGDVKKSPREIPTLDASATHDTHRERGWIRAAHERR